MDSTKLVYIEVPEGESFEKSILYARNGVNIGEILLKEDGYYDWWPSPKDSGCWPSYMLRAIADLLDQLNRPYEVQLNEFFR